MSTENDYPETDHELLGQRRHHPVSRRSLAGIVAFIVILALGQSAVTLILLNQVEDNTNKIKMHELVDHHISVNADNGILYAITLSRQTDFRQCQRGVNSRAVINLLVSDTNDNRIKAMKLYDCAPNLSGQPPVRALTGAESKHIYNQARRGDLP